MIGTASDTGESGATPGTQQDTRPHTPPHEPHEPHERQGRLGWRDGRGWLGWLGCCAALVAAGLLVFRYLPAYGVSNAWVLDGYCQHFPAYYHLSEVWRAFLRNPADGFALWSWNLGLGADTLGALQFYVGDPFALLGLLWPLRSLEQAYLALYYLRLLAAGLAAYAYLRGMKSRELPAIVGSLMYVFVTYALFSCLKHPMFANPMVWLPLVLLGAEKVLAKGRPYLFVGALFVAGVSSFYFYYQLTIVVVIYIVARYFELTPTERRWRDLPRTALSVAGYYLLGTMLAAFLLVPILVAFFGSSRSGVHQQLGLFYSVDYYRSYVSALLSNRVGGHSAPGGFSMLGFLVLPVLFMRPRNTVIKVMVAAFAAFLVFPVFATVFNGFAFPSFRFLYMAGLFMAVPAALFLSEPRAFAGREIAAMFGGLAACVVGGFIAAGTPDASMLATLWFGAAMWATFAAETFLAWRTRVRMAEAGGHEGPQSAETSDAPAPRGRLLTHVAVLLLVLGSIAISGVMSFDRSFDDRLDPYVASGEVLTGYRFRAGKLAGSLEGDGLFRVDKQLSVLGSDLAPTPSNDPLVQDYNGLSYYFSIIDGGVSDYLAGLDDRSMRMSFDYNGLDDRAALDTLNGVTYYLASENATQYAPYGFSPVRQEGRTVVYKNDHALPIGYVYHSAVSAETYGALTPLQKQQALLQGVVLSGGVAANVPRIRPESDLVEVPYSVTSGPGAVWDPATKTITTAEPNMRFELAFDPVPNAELYTELTGISFASKAGLAAEQPDANAPVDATDAEAGQDATAAAGAPLMDALAAPPGAIDLAADPMRRIAFGTSTGRAKVERVESPTFEYYWGDNSMLVNLGYFSAGTNRAYVRPISAGTISFADFKIHAVKMDRYAEQTAKLRAEGMRNVTTGTNRLSGTVTSHGDGVLFLSIPYSTGWRATVDGTPVKVERANVAFCGIPVTNGEHRVELRYTSPGLVAGGAISAIGLLGVLGLVWVRRRRVPGMSDTWVAIDFETATREANSACSLGIAIVRDGRVERAESWLIQPPFNEYEYRNSLIHGITAEDTALAPDFAEVWWEVGPLLAEGPLLAHNAPFDIRVLRALIASHELVVPSHSYVCTVALARRAFPDLRRHTLNVMCDHCGIALTHHDAASDAAACAELALACAQAAGVRSVAEAVASLGVSVGRL